jgi:LysR family transcriptional regulator, low CO2-responsive transcriptional regulator
MIRRVTFRQLQIFCTVTRHLSFVRASEELHLSQPAVSMQIKQLEQAIGLQLLDRFGRRLRLTEAGQRLHEHAARVIGELKDAEAALDQLKGLRGGTVTVGMVSTAKYFAPKLLARFTAKHPDLDLRLLTGNRGALLGLLYRNEIDLAIMGRPPRELDMIAEAFAQHPYVFIAPIGHRLTHAKEIDIFALRDETLLLREPDSGTRMLNDEYLRKCLFVPKRALEMDSNETIKQAVMAGMGLALISRHTLELELKHRAIAVLDVVGTPVLRTWHVAHMTEKRLSPAASALRNFVLTNGGAYLRDEFEPARMGPRKRIATAGATKKVSPAATKKTKRRAGTRPTDPRSPRARPRAARPG